MSFSSKFKNLSLPNDNKLAMKIYYAHPMIMYGSLKESEDLKIISEKYPEAEIIDPRYIRNKDLENRMLIYLNTIENCDLVVVRRIPNFQLTAGIGKEINHALEKGITVLEIKNKKFYHLNKKQSYFTREQSNILFDELRQNKKYVEFCGSII